jgi:hypothetical protein
MEGSSRGQPTRGNLLALGLGGGLTTLHRKTQACYEMLHTASDVDGFFGDLSIMVLRNGVQSDPQNVES